MKSLRPTIKASELKNRIRNEIMMREISVPDSSNFLTLTKAFNFKHILRAVVFFLAQRQQRFNNSPKQTLNNTC